MYFYFILFLFISGLLKTNLFNCEIIILRLVPAVICSEQ